jgi:hypothetical protein
MFPTIPENLDQLSAAELRALAKEIREACLAALASIKAEGFDGDRDEVIDLVQKAKEARVVVLAAAVAAEAADGLEAELGDDSEDPAEPDETQESLAEEDEDETQESLSDDDEGEGKPEVTAGAGRKVRARVGAGGGTLVKDTRATADQFLAYDGVSGKAAGEAFASMSDICAALLERMESVRTDSDQKFPVAYAKANFDGRRLSEDWVKNLDMFQSPEMTAALCAPFTPNYNLACMNTLARPVRASLSTFAAPRMGVKIYPSPSLSDITTGVGQWTAEDDANVNAVKEDCARIVCGTPVDFTMYGVYRCITIQNMMQMSFPELVEAWLNRLGAAHARLAETLILEAMATTTDTVFGEHVGYNASVSVVKVLLQYLTAYREQQRWEDGEMDLWLHRSIMTGLKADQVSRRNTNGSVLRVPSDGEINALFTDAGFSPHWFLDRPSWMTPLPAFDVGGKLADFPRNIEMLIAPRGKYALMDRGELNIGVSGNGMYRDNESNRHNNFTFFFENFEGVVDTTSCPAHIVELNNVCWNGQQIADVVIDCEGDDEIGIGS